MKLKMAIMVLCVAAAGVGGGFLLPRSALQQKSSLAVDSLSGLGESPNQAIPPSVQVALLNQRVAQLEQSVAKQVSSVSSNEHPVLENTDMPPTPEDGIKRAAELIRQHEHAVHDNRRQHGSDKYARPGRRQPVEIVLGFLGLGRTIRTGRNCHNRSSAINQIVQTGHVERKFADALQAIRALGSPAVEHSLPRGPSPEKYHKRKQYPRHPSIGDLSRF